jgi:hypothetical protein
VPQLLAAGGSLGKLGVWNTLETAPMQERLPGAEAALDEDGRVMGGAVAGMGALDVDSSDDGEGEEGEEGEEGAPSDDRATAREPRGAERRGGKERQVGSWTTAEEERKAGRKPGGKKAKGKGKAKVKGR